jgi:hypothetical protein
MDEIYSKATQVNVHLGPGDEKSDVAIQAVKKLALAYISAMMADRSGVGRQATRRKYEEIADEVLGESLIWEFLFLVHSIIVKAPLAFG